MGSRSKKIIELLLNNANIVAEKENIDSNNLAGTEQGPSSSCRSARRSLSTSSSSSSSSSSTSFYEDSDDSVRDPDYKMIDQKCNNSSDEDENVSQQEITVCSPRATGTDQSIEYQVSPPVFTSDISITDVMDGLNTTQENPTSPASLEPLPLTSGNNALTVPTKKGRKREKNDTLWKKNIAKRMRNLGKPYESSRTKKIISERQMKEPCKETCKYKCGTKILEFQRKALNEDYWKLGNIEKQWTFIANSIETVLPKHRYVKMDPDGNFSIPKRNKNNAFFFNIANNKTRVCKLFFANTLGINYRPIDTALQKKNNFTNISTMKDNRGCHGNQPKVDERIKTDIKQFIEAIPKIESHYTRANSKRHYIDGGKSVADLHRDYVEECKKNNISFGNYTMFYRIFTNEFNISFFSPKKDLCELCEIYKNSQNEDKEAIKEKYESHIKEKELSREEKAKDKANGSIKVAVYDLQAVHQCPKGEVSIFYYKSKLNVLNLTVYDLHTNDVSCFVWDESHAHRGVNEIGTCVYKYLQKINKTGENIDVVFYSDNCAGQQKNKFMLATYFFAVQHLINIRSITHKYLIKGHTQNEGDSAHSQIERQVTRQLKSGPMYTPDAFIGAIKAARKKSEPFKVTELCFADFYDWKRVCTQMGIVLQKDEENNPAKIGNMKIIKILKNEPRTIYFKTSYSEEVFKKAVVIKRKKEIDVVVSRAYEAKVGLSERKKSDLMELVNKNVIPRYYRPFFEGL